MSYEDIDKLETDLCSKGLSVRDLYSAWEQRQPIPDPAKAKKNGTPSPSASKQFAWMQNDARLITSFTRRALEKEEFLLVCDCAREALLLWDRAEEKDRLELVRVRINYAEALARLGDTRRARQAIEPCVEDEFRPKLGRGRKTEILVRLGNILRQESRYAAAHAAQVQTAEQALEFYARALAVDPDHLEALSLSASVAFVTAEADSPLRARAVEQARRVLKKVRDEENSEGSNFELVERRAEAHAVLGDTEAAAASYGELAGLAEGDAAALANARYWSQFLAGALGEDRDYFKKAFPPLQLVVFSGHMPDRPGQPPRFPPYAVPAVRETIEHALEAHHVLVGLCSASAGADLLFADALRRRGGSVHLVLPWAREEFRRTNVQPFEPDDKPPTWDPLFESAVEGAATVREIGQAYSNDSRVGFEYQLEVIAGLALHTARVSRLDVQPMVLWDEKMGRGLGGTESFVDFWRRRFGLEPVILRLPPVAAEEPVILSSGSRKVYDPPGLPEPRCEHGIFRQEVKSMLFADIVGYSKLSESVIPEFVNLFLGRVSRTLSGSRYAPLHVNTWGDAIYAVFDYARDAGCFALELTQLIHEGRADWLAAGLYWEDTAADGTVTKHPLNVRVGLHTGPVFMHYNPVIRQLGFTGSHVSRAARIEPVTTPGEVFASEEFAALSETNAEAIRRTRAQAGNADGLTGFVCEYAGSMPLAKGYPGRHRIYRVLPDKVFAIDELAQAIHQEYLDAALLRGEKPPGANGSLRPWDELPPDIKQANHAQAADIPNKLRVLGYELAPGHGLKASEIPLTAEKVEAMAIHEHDRWASERQRRGWVYGPVRDNARKHHPLLVPWEALDEVEREKDRVTVKNLPAYVEKAGFRVRKLGG